MKSIGFIVEIFKKHPREILANIGVAVVMSLLGMLSFLSLPPVIDMFLYPDGQGQSAMTHRVVDIFHALGIPTAFPVMVSVFMGLVMFTAIFQVLGYMMLLRTKYAVSRDIMIGSMQDFFNAKWIFFSGSDQGKIYSTLNRELNMVGDGLSGIGATFSQFFQVIILMVVPFSISWQVTLICLMLGGGVSIGFILLSRLSYGFGQRNTDTANVVTSLFYENISGAKMVLGHGNADEAIKRLRVAHDAHLDATLKSQSLTYALTTAYRPIGVVVVVTALFVSRIFVIPVAELTVLLLALLQMTNLFGSLVAQKSMISGIVPGYEQIQSLRQRARQMKQTSGDKVFTKFEKEIRLDHVSFSYPGREPVLRDIDMVIPKGKTIAFVGRSGVGKSTMIDILMGFHDPQSGRIVIDGVPLSDYEVNSYRQLLGYVPQESILFNMSVKDNLLWARPEASHEDMVQACRLAYADEFIDQMPQTYDTVVGDRGVRLSGGQIQRMALARAFLRKPEIFLLDEATSSLDSHSETLIQKAIESISGKATVIVVAHRLATIRRADIIFVLGEGRIIERGNYQDLCGQGGSFADFARLQALGLQA